MPLISGLENNRMHGEKSPEAMAYTFLRSPEFAFIILNEFSSKYLGHAYQSDELISLVQNGTNLLEVIRNILCRDEYKRKAGFS
jgi:hypothetical protein